MWLTLVLGCAAKVDGVPAQVVPDDADSSTQEDADSSTQEDASSPSDSSPSDARPEDAGSNAVRTILADQYPSLQHALDAARPGERVLVPPGTYTIDETFRFQTGVSIGGTPDERPILRSAGSNTVLIDHTTAFPLRDLDVHDMVFDNIRIRVAGNATNKVHQSIHFRNLRFQNAPVSEDWNEHYLQISYGQNIVVDQCEFLRSSSAQGGRGINIWRTRSAIVKDSTVGTSHDWEPANTHGFFKTAINVSGYDHDTSTRSREVRLTRNVMRRASSPRCPYNDGTDDACQDHAVYGWGFEGLSITGNRIDGWDTTGSGGLKLRNAETARVERNRLAGSGLLFYTYDSTSMPKYFRQVLAQHNRIVVGSCRGSYCGGFYWRNFGSPAATQVEQDILWLDNDFTGGTISLSATNLGGHCLEGNRNVSIKTGNSSGAYQRSNCRPSAPWAQEPADVYDGDFNADGLRDFAHVRANRWQVHLRTPAATRISDWGPSENYSTWTSVLGALVGNFAGDDADDIVFFGRCGSPSVDCWRLYESRKTTFAVHNFGADPGFSGETAQYGLQVGDFDANGYADIVYRGTCGSEACWRVQLSDGASFTAAGWGDGAYFSDETRDFGILTGDVDGDRKSDLIYRGKCGSGEACFRVQLAQSGRFSGGRNWGDQAYLSADSRHLGMVAVDIDADGRTDIGYRGYCGSRVPQWRYHVSNGSGFDVVCRPIRARTE